MSLIHKTIFAAALLFIFAMSCAHAPSGSPAAPLVREGRSLFNAGKIDESANFFRRAYGLDPTYAPAYMMLGRVYLEKDDTYRAEMFFRKSLALDDSNSEIYGWLGDIYWTEGDTAEAFEFYEKCPRDDPHYAILHYRLGMRAFQNGNRNRAREEFEKALSRPEYWGGHYGMGRLAFSRGKYDEAIGYLMQADTPEAEPEVMYWLARSFEETGRFPEAYLYYVQFENRSHGAKKEMVNRAAKGAECLYDSVFACETRPPDTCLIIPFDMETPSDLFVGIYDAEGRLIKMLFDGWITTGEYSMDWDGYLKSGERAQCGYYLGLVDFGDSLDLVPLCIEDE